MSGMSTMLEEARALGELRKQGWAPKRTIVYCAWDGEEPALLGSTEWVETHVADLQRHAVAYLNTDGSGRGFLSIGGSHSLEHFLNDVARDISDPETAVSVWKRTAGAGDFQGQDAGGAGEDPRSRGPAHRRARIRLRLLAVPPARRHRLARFQLRRRGQATGSITRSTTTYYFYTHFLDTDFAYERALAQTMGTAVIRLADADLLPFEFTNLADTVQMYVQELRALLKAKQDLVRDRNRDLVDGVFAAVNDPRRPEVAPRPEVVPPAINFAPLENAASTLTESARRYSETATAVRSKLAANPQALTAINQKLQQSEQQLLDPAGLPGRSWYKHLLYAPGFYTGYGVKTVPGVREGLEQGQYAQAEAEAARAAAAITRLATFIDSITSDMLRVPVKK